LPRSEKRAKAISFTAKENESCRHKTASSSVYCAAGVHRRGEV
jgi:hypothetical protein